MFHPYPNPILPNHHRLQANLPSFTDKRRPQQSLDPFILIRYCTSIMACYNSSGETDKDSYSMQIADGTDSGLNACKYPALSEVNRYTTGNVVSDEMLTLGGYGLVHDLFTHYHHFLTHHLLATLPLHHHGALMPRLRTPSRWSERGQRSIGAMRGPIASPRISSSSWQGDG